MQIPARKEEINFPAGQGLKEVHYLLYQLHQAAKLLSGLSQLEGGECKARLLPLPPCQPCMQDTLILHGA